MDRNPVFTIINEAPAEIFALERHVLCPHYDACLDDAIRQHRSFECSQCLFKKKNVTIYLIHDGWSA